MCYTWVKIDEDEATLEDENDSDWLKEVNDESFKFFNSCKNPKTAIWRDWVPFLYTAFLNTITWLSRITADTLMRGKTATKTWIAAVPGMSSNWVNKLIIRSECSNTTIVNFRQTNAKQSDEQSKFSNDFQAKCFENLFIKPVYWDTFAPPLTILSIKFSRIVAPASWRFLATFWMIFLP